MRLSVPVTKEFEKMRHYMFRNLPIAVAVAGVLLIAMPPSVLAQTAGKTMTTPSGLQIIDSTVGTGAAPKPGQICVMHYTGWLYEDGKKGKKFDSSVDRNEPFEFPIGQRKVIALVPAGDHLALADRKLERLIAVDGRVEFLALLAVLIKPAGVMHDADLAGLWRSASADRRIDNLQS